MKTYYLPKHEHEKVRKQTAIFYLEHKLDGYSDFEIARMMGLKHTELYRYLSVWNIPQTKQGMKERLKSAKRTLTSRRKNRGE